MYTQNVLHNVYNYFSSKFQITRLLGFSPSVYFYFAKGNAISIEDLINWFKYTNCYLNMKLQIVSKLVRKSSQNKQNTLSYSIIPPQQLNQQYYPQKYGKAQQKEDRDSRNHKSRQLTEFINYFQQNYTVVYTKREESTTSFKRKLQQELINLQAKDQRIAHKKNQHEFSFKKDRSIYNNDKSITLQTEASETQTKNRETYIRPNSKGKIRKFNSLVTFKGEATSNSTLFVNRQDSKKNASNYKQTILCQYKAGVIPQMNRLSFNPNPINTSDENLEPRNAILSHQENKTQRCGQDIKLRLSKIRKELNMIYQQKKQPQFKLKLF